MNIQSRIHKLRAPLISGLSALALVALAGCGPVRLIANTNIPAPLVVKMPIAVALFIPKEEIDEVLNRLDDTLKELA